jgi:hypothetical protein
VYRSESIEQENAMPRSESNQRTFTAPQHAPLRARRRARTSLRRSGHSGLLGLLCLTAAIGGCRYARQSGALEQPVAAQSATAEKTARTKTKPPAIPLGLNLGSLNYYAPTLAFVDVMKNADDPQTTGAAFGGPWNTNLIDKVPTDKFGYPLEVPYSGAGVSEPQKVRYSVVSLLYPGRYTLFYEGDGEFEFPAAPVKLLEQTAGKLALDVQHGEGPLFLTIARSNKQNHVRNVRLIMPGFEHDYASKVFHPRFIEEVRGAAVVRFMDWQRTNDSKLKHWSERATPEMSQGTWRGAAIETMIDLSNRLGADPWLCVPHAADDDFVEHMAALVRDKLAPGRVVYIEYSNEVWNGIFSQYAYAEDQGCKAGLNHIEPYKGSCTEDGVRLWAGTKYTAKRAARIFEIFERVLGGSDRLVRVLAGQAGWVGRNEALLSAFEDKTINPKHVRADALAIAPYFGAIANDLVEHQAVDTISVDLILQRMEASIPEKVRDATQQNKTLADRFGLRLVAYEGGQHLAANGKYMDDDALTAKLIEANRNPRMAQLYAKMFDAWYAASGHDLLVLFNSAETPSKFGSWGLLESQEQLPERAPKYQAFREQLVKLALSSKSGAVTPAAH